MQTFLLIISSVICLVFGLYMGFGYGMTYGRVIGRAKELIQMIMAIKKAVPNEEEAKSLLTKINKEYDLLEKGLKKS